MMHWPPVPKGPYMRKGIVSLALVLLAGILGAAPLSAAENRSVLDFTMRSIDDGDIPLSTYRGKVLLIVNVASKCGLTPQYEGLEAIYQKYGDRGLVILGFPANNFGLQEPATNAEIQKFCTTQFNVTFPMFSKIIVKGEYIDPLYDFLTDRQTNPRFAGEIKWNFTKFLIDRNGRIINRFEPKTAPDSEEIVRAIEAALDEK